MCLCLRNLSAALGFPTKHRATRFNGFVWDAKLVFIGGGSKDAREGGRLRAKWNFGVVPSVGPLQNALQEFSIIVCEPQRPCQREGRVRRDGVLGRAFGEGCVAEKVLRREGLVEDMKMKNTNYTWRRFFLKVLHFLFLFLFDFSMFLSIFILYRKKFFLHPAFFWCPPRSTPLRTHRSKTENFSCLDLQIKV